MKFYTEKLKDLGDLIVNTEEQKLKFLELMEEMDEKVKERWFELTSILGEEVEYIVSEDFQGGGGGVKTPDDKYVMLVNLSLMDALVKAESGFYLLEVVAHEMCHLKQCRDDRLVNVEGEGLYWEGVYYTQHDILPFKRSYLESPWEEEAYHAGIEEMVRWGVYADTEEAWVAYTSGYARLERLVPDLTDYTLEDLNKGLVPEEVMMRIQGILTTPDELLEIEVNEISEDQVPADVRAKAG